MMPDYMESLVCQLGLDKVLIDLHVVVAALAHEQNDAKLWLLEQDLSMAIQELQEDES